MKLAFADAWRYVADPDAHDARQARRPARQGLPAIERAKLIDIRSARRISATATPASGGTVYLTAADASGMMVSFIQSNYMGFGSGVVVPAPASPCRTAASGFVLEPGHPNWSGRASGRTTRSSRAS